MKLQLMLLLVLFAVGREQPNREAMLANRVQNYFKAWNNHDFDHPHFTTFIRNTIRLWHNEKKGPGIISIHDAQSGWKATRWKMLLEKYFADQR